eukprot:TRINITY_DN1330_c0_g1_i18.p1 TRINITY_DN1330_c0_g1~~TRINITY_DN1330_c0_g1_i18.p1  ORF type:complete len:916 (+),score=198.97 TRINITY_DN1330_c0_g1_i18:1218-3965(+)
MHKSHYRSYQTQQVSFKHAGDDTYPTMRMPFLLEMVDVSAQYMPAILTLTRRARALHLAALFGGGISQKDSSWLSIRDSAFYRNAADGLEGGGAILTLGRVGGEGLIFEGNSGMNAGTISIYRPGAQVRLRDVQINGSSATQDGGAVLAVDGARFSCTKCVIDAASADGYGGALYGYAGSTVTLDDVTISGSSSSTLGGAIYSLGMLAVTSSTFLENSALRGGAIATEDSVSSTEAGTAPRTTIVDSTFRDNSAKLGGGALYLSSSTGLAQGNTFGGNTAQTGGAILLGTSVSTGFELTDGTFVNNAAVDGAGGAIVQEGHELLVDVSANTFKDSTSTCCYAPSSAKVDCHDVDAGLGTNLQCCGLGSYLAPTAKSDTTAFKCVNCDPATMSCTAGGLQLDSIPLQAGYWRQNLDSSKIQECFNRDACKGGAPDTASVTGATYCADGYQGPYCALCATGHTPVYGYTCASCDGTNAAVGIFGRVVIFLVLAAVVVWLIVGSGVEAALQEADAMAALPGGSKRRRTRRVLLKFAAYTVSMLSSLRVPLVVLQILTTYYLISGAPLPRVYSEFLHYMQFINLNWEWLLSFGCLIQVNFYDTLLLYTLTPMAVLAFLMTPRALLGAACTRRRLSPSLRKKLELFQMRDLRLLLIFTFVIFSSVSTQILQTFSCENFGSSESYLRADYSISCNTPAHQAYKIYAACMILVYPIGIPALYAVVLWHERRFVRQALAGGDAAPGVTAVLRPLSSAQMAEKLASSFLSEPYRDRVFFWEVVECGRRLMLTGLMVFITPNSPSQTAVACLLAFVTTFAYVSVHPHLRRLDRGLYILGTYTIFAAFLSTLLMLSEYTSSYSEDVVGVLLIMLNVTLIVVPPVVTALSIRASRKTSEPAASGTAVVVPVVTALPLAVDIVVAPKK